MKIEIRLFAYFREGRERVQTLDVDNKISILEILSMLNIDEDEVAILLLNGFDGSLDRELNDGDVLAIFPPVGGG